MFDFDSENLIGNEYFPSELPPCFSTKCLSKNHKKIIAWTSGVPRRFSIPLIYDGYKSEYARRKFAVPSLYHYAKAVDCIIKNSEAISKIMDESEISISKPIQGEPLENKPYKKISYSIRETQEIIEKLYQDNLYQIIMDISSFFESIYTHTIPWAMHSKKVSKNSDGKTLAGDKLDICLRGMNHNQTNGILVGNAVSRIISEIILCTVDKKIQGKFKNVNIGRYVDDYYIFVKDATQIPSIIAFITKELGAYELILNENKRKINESPFVFGKYWVEEIKLFLHVESDVFFNKVISLYLKYKDTSILRYGMVILSNHIISKKKWEVMESKLLNLWVKFPSLSDIVIKIFLDNISYIKKNSMRKAIYSIFERCITLNHNQEVIWAVWFAKIFEIKNIRNDYIIKILKSENSLAIIIMLDIIDTGDYKNSPPIRKAVLDLREYLKELDMEESLEGDKKEGQLLWTKEWLLAYEADFNLWLNINNEKFEYARNNPYYKNLIKNKINFYDKEFEYSKETTKYNLTQYITKEEFLLYTSKIENLLEKMKAEMDDLEFEQTFELIRESRETIISRIEDNTDY